MGYFSRFACGTATPIEWILLWQIGVSSTAIFRILWGARTSGNRKRHRHSP